MKQDTNEKWIIGSTGVNDYGTRVSIEIKNYLESKNFVKAFSGNPVYVTTHEYSETEMKKIAQEVKNIRVKAHPTQASKVSVKYWKASSENSI